MSMTPFDSHSLDEALFLFLLHSDNDNDHTTYMNLGDEIAFPQSNGEFMVRVDVQHFRPEELKVRLVGDYLVIEGRHDEKMDEHGTISRQFERKYKIPEHIDKTDFHSSVSSDGVLTVISKKKLEAARLAAGQPSLQSQDDHPLETGSEIFD